MPVIGAHRYREYKEVYRFEHQNPLYVEDMHGKVGFALLPLEREAAHQSSDERTVWERTFEVQGRTLTVGVDPLKETLHIRVSDQGADGRVREHEYEYSLDALKAADVDKHLRSAFRGAFLRTGQLDSKFYDVLSIVRKIVDTAAASAPDSNAFIKALERMGFRRVEELKRTLHFPDKAKVVILRKGNSISVRVVHPRTSELEKLVAKVRQALEKQLSWH